MKFSIVTPTLNAAAYLEHTAGSILSQAGDGVELQWIVVDGGSTDATLPILTARSAKDDRISIVHAKGTGQSDAISEGLARADGDVLAWLNADDLYTPGALEAVARAFADHPAASWLVGQCEIIDESARPIRHGVTRYKNRSLARYSRTRLLRENFISQPATFWRRTAWEQVGARLDPSLHYTMDYDLWLRLAQVADPLILPTVLAQFRLHDASKSGQRSREQFDEQYRVACRHFGPDRWSRWVHRFNVEKIVAAYRLMRLVGK